MVAFSEREFCCAQIIEDLKALLHNNKKSLKKKDVYSGVYLERKKKNL